MWGDYVEVTFVAVVAVMSNQLLCHFLLNKFHSSVIIAVVV